MSEKKTIADMLAMPGAEDIDFEVTRDRQIGFRPLDLGEDEEHVTVAEAIDVSLANAKLEGIEPSDFTRWALEQLRRGEITLERYRQLGKEHYQAR